MKRITAGVLSLVALFVLTAGTAFGSNNMVYKHTMACCKNFDFLTELTEYDRISGDQAFLSRHWPGTLKAYQYCLSTLDKSDGLPRVPADKMSGNEQDRLTDELTLSASWVS